MDGKVVVVTPRQVSEARLEADATGECPLCDSEFEAFNQSGERVTSYREVTSRGGQWEGHMYHDDACPVMEESA
jgi:hypothetical protein